MGKLDWLLDHREHIIIGADWRIKQKQVLELPRWYYPPEPNVRAYFDARRGLGEMPEMTQDDWHDVREHIKRDPVAFLWHFCFLKDRDTRRKHLCTPTAAQLIIVWRIAVLIHHQLPVRLDLLKERQGGLSWLFEQVIYWMIYSREHVGALSLAHEKGAAQRMFSYLRETHWWMPRELRPSVLRDSRGELYLAETDEDVRDGGDEGQDSFAIVQTAGNEFAGTGTPVQILHLSEVGKWHKVVADPGILYVSSCRLVAP